MEKKIKPVAKLLKSHFSARIHARSDIFLIVENGGFRHRATNQTASVNNSSFSQQKQTGVVHCG